jgi:hypothetical protein
MRQRGRKSAESLVVVPAVLVQRPDPPAELSIEQAEVWRAYVADMPADWFTPKTWPDLIGLCRLVTNSRLLGQELREYEEGIPKDREGFGRYRHIQKMHESEALSITTLETKLRLTHQSKNDHHRAEKARALQFPRSLRERRRRRWRSA